MPKLIKAECKKLVEGKRTVQIIGKVERVVQQFNRATIDKIVSLGEQLINTNTPNLIPESATADHPNNTYTYQTGTKGVTYEIQYTVYDLD